MVSTLFISFIHAAKVLPDTTRLHEGQTQAATSSALVSTRDDSSLIRSHVTNPPRLMNLLAPFLPSQSLALVSTVNVTPTLLSAVFGDNRMTILRGRFEMLELYYKAFQEDISTANRATIDRTLRS